MFYGAKETKTSANLRQRSEENEQILIFLCDWVCAEISTLAFFAMFTHPYFIELVHCLFDNFCVICKDSSFKVSFIIRLHTDTGTSKVRTPDIHLLPIENHHLEVHTRAEHSLQAVIQHRIFVKVLAEVWTWFFGMYKSYLHATPNELGNKSQKRLLLLSYLNI